VKITLSDEVITYNKRKKGDFDQKEEEEEEDHKRVAKRLESTYAGPLVSEVEPKPLALTV
ncbi:predicted protein, partial [Arabidopsis lyrata subsp. lyrata]